MPGRRQSYVFGTIAYGRLMASSSKVGRTMGGVAAVLVIVFSVVLLGRKCSSDSPADTASTSLEVPPTPLTAAPLPAAIPSGKPLPGRAKANCSPPYFVDADGRRIFKQECR